MRDSEQRRDVVSQCRNRLHASASPLIAILDNDAITLDGLRRIVERNRLGTVAWCTQSGHEAVRLSLDPDTMPHLLLTDMSLDGISGVDVCRQIRKHTDMVAILGITAFPLTKYAPLLMEAGAQGIVAKNRESQIVAAINAVLHEKTCAQGFESPRNAHIRLRYTSTDTRILLSDREGEVMALLSQGLSIAEVADRMQVNRATAATYLSRARRKLNAKNIRQAIAIWTGENE